MKETGPGVEENNRTSHGRDCILEPCTDRTETTASNISTFRISLKPQEARSLLDT
jgi:hypothetical protein